MPLISEVSIINFVYFIRQQIDNDVVIPRLPVDTETHKFHDWTIIYKKSHILKSMCINENRCKLGEPGCCELCE